MGTNTSLIIQLDYSYINSINPPYYTCFFEYMSIEDKNLVYNKARLNHIVFSRALLK
jgi:hypothetical protein